MTNESTEKKFRKCFTNEEGIWITKLKVLYQPTPFDYLVLAKNCNYAFEIKELKSKYFDMQHDIKPHQTVGLKRFQEIGEGFKAFVFIAVKEGDKMWTYYNIPIDSLLLIDSKSIKKEEFEVLFNKYNVKKMCMEELLK